MDREAVKERWLPVGVVAGVLFAINLVGRWAAKLLKSEGPQALADREAYAGFIAFGAILLVFLVMAVLWGRNRPLGRTVADLIIAGTAGCALSVFVAPPLAGTGPFSGGAGQFFAQIWWYAGLGIAGVGLGIMALIALGQDHRAKQLKLFAERSRARTRRA